jgi:hypothetical protein
MPAAFSIPSRWRKDKCPFGCGNPIEKGEPITKRGPKGAAAWGHADCSTSISEMTRRKFDDPHGVLAEGEEEESTWEEPEELPVCVTRSRWRRSD